MLIKFLCDFVISPFKFSGQMIHFFIYFDNRYLKDSMEICKKLIGKAIIYLMTALLSEVTFLLI